MWIDAIKRVTHKQPELLGKRVDNLTGLCHVEAVEAAWLAARRPEGLGARPAANNRCAVMGFLQLALECRLHDQAPARIQASMLALSDSQLQLVMTAAGPLPAACSSSALRRGYDYMAPTSSSVPCSRHCQD